MNAALIVMTILGCDDSVTQCHYVTTVNQSWHTVAECDKQSERYITRHQNVSYPVVVAVCESNRDKITAELEQPSQPTGSVSAVEQPEAAPTPAEAEERRGLAARTLAVVRKVMPDGSRLKSAIKKPVRYAENGYSWVVSKIRD